jgi:hypothetical protein
MDIACEHVMLTAMSFLLNNDFRPSIDNINDALNSEEPYNIVEFLTLMTKYQVNLSEVTFRRNQYAELINNLEALDLDLNGLLMYTMQLLSVFKGGKIPWPT